jgi:hypothetical protein
LPGDYIFVKHEKNEIEYYGFDIEKKLISVQINYYTNENIMKSIFIQIIHTNENVIIENYIYDTESRIIEIKREQKNKSTFIDEEHFPDNIYKSMFRVEYNGNETIPNKILWNDKIVYAKK